MIGVRDYKPMWATADLYCDTKEEMYNIPLVLDIEGQNIQIGVGSTIYCKEDKKIYILAGEPMTWEEM